ncbi:MAG: alpha/beta hydrolase [Gemmatimonadetes bacterium]|nr:alpha/beta hydrolase [Gemmatimonadota bacterium]
MTQESMVGGPGQEAVSIGTAEGVIIVEMRGPRTAGSTIVCLHGLSANRATWRPVARMMERRRRFLLVDLLGRGESDPAPDARYDLESAARRLAQLLDTVGVERPILAGHSHGAAIAVAAANRVRATGLLLANPVTPDLPRPRALRTLRWDPVRRVMGPTARLFRRPLTRYMLVRRVFADRTAIPKGLVDRYADPWADPGRAAALPRILLDWCPAELQRWASPLDVPVSVFAGDADRRIEPELARRWAAVLGGGFELAAGCGHSAPEERTMEVAEALEDLARTISAREQEEKPDDQE